MKEKQIAAKRIRNSKQEGLDHFADSCALLDHDYPESTIRLPDHEYRQLAASMISQAILDAEPRHIALQTTGTAWTVDDQQSALSWIFVVPQPLIPYSFTNCCEILEIPEETVRKYIANHIAEVRMGIKRRKGDKFTPKKYLRDPITRPCVYQFKQIDLF